MGKISIRPEQIYVATEVGDKFVIGGETHITFPWHSLCACYVYVPDEKNLMALLSSATSGGYMVLDGSHTERRGLRGFEVGIGAWGWKGSVNCRTVEAWCMEFDTEADPVEETGKLQEALRKICLRLNREQIPFRASGLKWISGLYREHNQEPEDQIEQLPVDIARMCRQAHIGGPIIHARTTLTPFLQLDRNRAYGNAMLEDLPCGSPYDVTIPPKNSLARWRPRDLMSATGIMEATVSVFDGPAVPLFPLLRPHIALDKNKILYPTGKFRGTWCTEELAYMEQTGKGRVETIHRAVTFEPRPVLAIIIKYIRSIEKDLPIKVKRLEHILYGLCARTPALHRFATGYPGGSPLLGDLLQPQMLQRLGPDTTIRHYRVQGRQPPRHPVYQISGKIIGKAPRGTMDRPDRSAWITMRNRVEISKIIDILDASLNPKQSGEYIGRIYVDGLDIEATPDQIPKIDGTSIQRYGPRINIFRSAAWISKNNDGSKSMEAAGFQLPPQCTEEDLVKIIRHDVDRDSGPFAGGRYWPSVKDEVDPRMCDNQRSKPFHLDETLARLLGFTRHEPI
jgi:hypothetical protein